MKGLLSERAYVSDCTVTDNQSNPVHLLCIIQDSCREGKQSMQNSLDSPDMSGKFWKCPSIGFNLAGQNVWRE